jgi:hypothetical protein
MHEGWNCGLRTAGFFGNEGDEANGDVTGCDRMRQDVVEC